MIRLCSYSVREAKRPVPSHFQHASPLLSVPVDPVHQRRPQLQPYFVRRKRNARWTFASGRPVALVNASMLQTTCLRQELSTILGPNAMVRQRSVTHRIDTLTTANVRRHLIY